MIRHVALFRWKEGTPPEAVEALAVGLATMPDVVPGIRRYEFGHDVGITDDAYDFAFVADFDDEAAYRGYTTHPDHVALSRTLVAPILDQIVRVQYHAGLIPPADATNLSRRRCLGPAGARRSS